MTRNKILNLQDVALLCVWGGGVLFHRVRWSLAHIICLCVSEKRILLFSSEFQKNICFCFVDYTKAFYCIHHNKLWKVLQQIGIPGYLTFLLRNLYAGLEATDRTGHGKMGWFKMGKGVCQGGILSPCLFNLYAEYSMRNARFDEARTGIKIAEKNVNNVRYTDDTTLMEEREEELKSLSMKVKEESE